MSFYSCLILIPGPELCVTTYTKYLSDDSVFKKYTHYYYFHFILHKLLLIYGYRLLVR